MYQSRLFTGLDSLQTQIVTRRKDFESLFDGFTKMRAISYVVSPDLLLDFFDKRGYTELEVVVGENLSGDYKRQLDQKGVDVTEQLVKLIEEGILRIFTSSRPIHTKLYMLEKGDLVRIIQTSANLTATAEEAKRQINYAWYLDIPKGDNFLSRISRDYESHRKGCSLFMEDLKNLLMQHSHRDRKQLIEAWLKGAASKEEDTELKGVLSELSLSLARNPDVKEEPAIMLRLPEAPKARKQVEQVLAPLRPRKVSQNHTHVEKLAFVRYVHETHRVPVLVLSRELQKLVLGLGDSLTELTEPPSDPASVNKTLGHIEAYLNTIDHGTSADPQAAKASMYEALLYLFFAPFAHEYMKAKRLRFGLVDTRGPRFLYIYGPSQNGKTTFLRFSLKLLTGSQLEPLSRQDFTESKIRTAAFTGTIFPLAFDDVDPSKSRGMDNILKLYWERWWSDQNAWPQLTVTSNKLGLADWAKSRVKLVNFDVHFAPSAASKEQLNRLFLQDNRVFKWFSYLYLRRLDSGAAPSDDELWLARAVVKELYQHAKRPIPKFFPEQPLEEVYDPGRRAWRDIVYIMRKAKVDKREKRKLVTFDKDMTYWEVRNYARYLPQTIKHEQKGNTISIENPADFDRWLEQPRQTRGLFSRLFGSRSKGLAGR